MLQGMLNTIAAESSPVTKVTGLPSHPPRAVHERGLLSANSEDDHFHAGDTSENQASGFGWRRHSCLHWSASKWPAL